LGEFFAFSDASKTGVILYSSALIVPDLADSFYKRGGK
jgi:hypothetical protein